VQKKKVNNKLPLQGHMQRQREATPLLLLGHVHLKLCVAAAMFCYKVLLLPC
jgi:hypothetical protein